jgi:hypothetical protein
MTIGISRKQSLIFIREEEDYSDVADALKIPRDGGALSKITSLSIVRLSWSKSQMISKSDVGYTLMIT